MKIKKIKRKHKKRKSENCGQKIQNRWFVEDMQADIKTENKLMYKQLLVSLLICIFIIVRQVFNEQVTQWIQSIFI